MSEVSGVVVAHGDLAESLVRVTEQISGVVGALRAISNDSCSPGDLRFEIERAAGVGPGVLFVDLASGSCAFASRSVGERSSAVAVVTGVNLPMLLDFVFHREMALPDLARRLVEKGHGGTLAFVTGSGGDAARVVPD